MFGPATARAIRRMRHHRGRADYKLRARTVEPVFGQIKTCQKLAMMSRRGLDACHSEWLLAAAPHNLRKLHIHRLSAQRQTGQRAEKSDRQPATALQHHPVRLEYTIVVMICVIA
jgi:hypothetical protein